MKAGVKGHPLKRGQLRSRNTSLCLRHHLHLLPLQMSFLCVKSMWAQDAPGPLTQLSEEEGFRQVQARSHAPAVEGVAGVLPGETVTEQMWATAGSLWIPRFMSAVLPRCLLP